MAVAADQWVVVSGAAGAIGSAVAIAFATRGRPVLALDKTFGNDPGLPGVTAVAGDLASVRDIQEALSTVSRSARISLLVNAVGLIWNEPVLAFRGAKLSTHGLDSFRAAIEANLTAPFLVASEVAARMARTGGGAIVNFSSIAAGGNAGQVAYSAAKAGIEGMTKTMAIELGPLGIRVNALALGFISVATTKAAVDAERLAEYRQRTPIGRLGEVDDVIKAIDFVVDNSFVNGAILKLDGGLRL